MTTRDNEKKSIYKRPPDQRPDKEKMKMKMKDSSLPIDPPPPHSFLQRILQQTDKTNKDV